MKILYIQFSGDFVEAYSNIYSSKKPGNYYGQEYTVSTLVKQAQSGLNITVLILQGNREEDTILIDNLRIKVHKDSYRNSSLIINDIEKIAPDRVILLIPDPIILKFLRNKRIPTFPVFADSFRKKAWYHYKSNRYIKVLKYELTHLEKKYVANHQINAAKSLIELGVSKSYVLAYDWEHTKTPEDWGEKVTINIKNKHVKLFYAGLLIKSKGIFDLIDSVSNLIETKADISLKIAGSDNNNTIQHYINDKKIDNKITLLGKISHEDVLSNMNSSDLVIVPSHHDYPEGLPMTIMESLMTHTPVLVSDHPMFIGRLGKTNAITFFKEQNIADLTEKITLIIRDYNNTYNERVINTSTEWHNLTLKLKWADMIYSWLFDQDELVEKQKELLQFI